MEEFINQFGYVAVAALIFLESVFPPIPSEVILPLSGFLTASTSMSLPGVIAASTIGALAGERWEFLKKAFRAHEFYPIEQSNESE